MAENTLWDVAPDSTPERRAAGALARLDRHRRAAGRRSPLGTADLRLLWLFADAQPRSLRRIAAEIGLEQSTVNRQVNAAVAERLLERRRPERGGPLEFAPAPDGIRAFEAHLEATLGRYRDALATFAPDERAAFLAQLERFEAAFGSLLAEDATGAED